MNNITFEFNGNWTYDIELPLLAGFQERKGAYTSVSSDKPSTGIFKLEFEDDLSDRPDPYPEQLLTLQFIYENQTKIFAAIIEKTLLELPGIVVNYDLQDEPAFQHVDAEKVKSLIGISTIHIKIISKEGYSYFDIQGGCNWDREHGLNLLFHKDRVVTFGGIDGGSDYDAEKEGGVCNPDHIREKENRKPRRYLPHPKYNTIKPSQQFANETYEHSLISQGYNEDFIAGVENGTIDVNGTWVSQDHTHLETACQFKNKELVKYLLGKNASIRFALHHAVGRGDYQDIMQMLLDKGANINSISRFGNTVLFDLVNSMEGIYRANDYYRSINRLDLISEQNMDQLANNKNAIAQLISIGADPTIKNRNGFSCFDIMRNATESSRTEVNEFLKTELQKYKQ